MLRNIWVESTLFSGHGNVKDDEEDLLWWLQALCARDQDYLKYRPETPSLYKSGVIWEAPKQFDGDCEEVMILKRALGAAAKQSDVRKVLNKIQGVLGGEHFCDIGVILELGAIDCDGLACWRAAELRQAGIPARPMMTKRKRPDGGTTYHALVVWPPFGSTPYESSEDPSLLLGMGGADRTADRAEEIRKNEDRCKDIRTMGAGVLLQPSSGATVDQAIESVLGMRRRPDADAAVAEVEKLLRGVA